MSASRLLIVAALMAAAVGGCASGASTESAPSVPVTMPVSTASPGTSPTPLPAIVSTADEAVARVVAAEPRFAAIRAFDPKLIGQSSWYRVEPALGAVAYRVTFRVGSGDCPSGCIDEHRWVYDVTRDGTVSLVSEGGDPASPDPSPR